VERREEVKSNSELGIHLSTLCFKKRKELPIAFISKIDESISRSTKPGQLKGRECFLGGGFSWKKSSLLFTRKKRFC